MLVRISDMGLAILENKELAHKVLFAIIAGNKNFECGKPIFVEGTGVSIEMVSSIRDERRKVRSQKPKASIG